MRGRLHAGEALAALLLILTALGFQFATGAYQTGFSALASDEPAHFVSGLMAHDYLTEAAPANPVTYAYDYYLHYPAVAIGHWPPVYYGAQALWFLLFGPSLDAALALNGLLTGVAAILISLIGRRLLGAPLGLAAGVAYLAIPLVVDLSAHVMAEPLMVVLSLAALERLSAWARDPRPGPLFLFALLAAGAILTKAVAWSLAPLPLASAVLTRRFDLLRGERFWFGQLLVFLLCAPWELGVRRMVGAGFVAQMGPAERRVGDLFAGLADQLGWVLLALALAGWGLAWLRLRAGESAWAPFLLTPPAVIGLALLAPVPVDSRYAILAWPSVLLLAGVSLSALADRLGAADGRRLLRPAAALLLALLAVPQFALRAKDSTGFERAVAELLGRDSLDGLVWLISSESGGELLFVAEAARRENPPQRYLLRATKYLARTSWMADGEYSSHVASVEETAARLAEAPVGVLVLHQSDPLRPFEHHRLLNELVRKHPESWRKAASFPVAAGKAGAGSLEVYVRQDIEKDPGGVIRLDMTLVLGEQLEASVER